MTIEEALVFLPVHVGEELLEVYEARVFTMQQFFLKQVPVSRLFRAKKERMLLEQEAYGILGGVVDDTILQCPEIRLANSDSLLEVVRVFHENRSRLNAALMRANSMEQLFLLSDLLLENMRNYALSMAVTGEVEGVKITKPEDEMELLSELKVLESKGKMNREVISELDSENCVRKEAIRLSLWLKMELDE